MPDRTNFRLSIKLVIMLILFLLNISCSSTKVTISNNFEKQKAKIAIMQFTSYGFKSGYDSYISDKLTQTLLLQGYIILDRHKVQNVFSDLRIEPTITLPTSDLKRIKEFSGVDIICFGSVDYQISRTYIWPYKVMFRFVDLSTGSVILQAECKNEKDWDGSVCIREIADELNKIGK